MARALLAVSVVGSALVIGAGLRGGPLLMRDAVSTPRSFLTDAALGLGDAPARAVPQDGLLALGSAVVPGTVLVVAVTWIALALSGVGAGLLASRVVADSWAAQCGGALAAIWNPWVAERMMQGHWSLLTGYAAIPWILVAAERIWRRRRGGWPMLWVAVVAAGLTPTGSVLAVIVVAVAVIGPLVWAKELRRGCAAVAVLVVGALPWLVATVVSSSALTGDPGGAQAFSLRAEPGLGRVLTALGMAGIWNADAVPASRTTSWAAVATIMFLVLVGLGWLSVVRGLDTPAPDGGVISDTCGRVPDELASRVYRDHASRDAKPSGGRVPDGGATPNMGGRVPDAGASPKIGGLSDDGPGPNIGGRVPDELASRVYRDPASRDAKRLLAISAALALATVALVVLASTAPGVAAMSFLIEHVPGAGLARDTQKFLALLMPAVAIGVAGSTRALSKLVPAGFAFAAVGTLIVAPLPDAALRLQPVDLPSDWQTVARMIPANEGAVALWPTGITRDYSFTPTQSLDPARRLLRAPVLESGKLEIDGHAVDLDPSSRASQVELALEEGAGPKDLASHGVGWVLVEEPDRNETPAGFAAQTPVFTGEHLRLYRVDNPVISPGASAAQRAIVSVAHLAWVVALAAALASLVVGSRSTRN
ncbi:hypothetical protein GOARA_078_00370 [Gordonia araii NBRC 100433]|uniref:Glycosyltransferase RgtA/B/C/D-like domain-containing protein n=1 Tax=Gordonia araii NBRC 100433 TaxID=1073574 RepID=G7H6W3_9ACTN|nr:hypothetical protein [Gordonia araii]NNG96005.1 hypothetical protein [Gordonia araii NBRC 100433]GAB11588.1 hypothetical protein GOARA_078_00370 [Gordonia araii NBRC 100433]